MRHCRFSHHLLLKVREGISRVLVSSGSRLTLPPGPLTAPRNASELLLKPCRISCVPVWMCVLLFSSYHFLLISFLLLLFIFSFSPPFFFFFLPYHPALETEMKRSCERVHKREMKEWCPFFPRVHQEEEWTNNVFCEGEGGTLLYSGLAFDIEQKGDCSGDKQVILMRESQWVSVATWTGSLSFPACDSS